MKETAGASVEAHDGTGGSKSEESAGFFAADSRAGADGIRPLGEPLQAQRAVEAVEIGQAGQQPIGMLAHVVAEWSRAELHDGGRERRVTTGARTGAGKLAKHAVDHGQGGGRVIHKLEPGRPSARMRAGDPIFWMVSVRVQLICRPWHSLWAQIRF